MKPPITPKVLLHRCTDDCFRIYRDGKWLPTAECNRKLRQDDIDHHREQKAKRRDAR